MRLRRPEGLDIVIDYRAEAERLIVSIPPEFAGEPPIAPTAAEIAAAQVYALLALNDSIRAVAEAVPNIEIHMHVSDRGSDNVARFVEAQRRQKPPGRPS